MAQKNASIRVLRKKDTKYISNNCYCIDLLQKKRVYEAASGTAQSVTTLSPLWED
jgi:hypothetical protein